MYNHHLLYIGGLEKKLSMHLIMELHLCKSKKEIKKKERDKFV